MMVGPGRCFLFVVVLLLFTGNSYVFSQQSVVHYEIRDGKLTDKTTRSSSHKRGSLVSIPQQLSFNPSAHRNSSVTAGISISLATSNSNCGYSNGSIIAEASGGTAPYTYKLDDAFGGYPPQKNGSFYFVTGGNYTLTVTDKIGQSATVPVTVVNVNDPPSLVISSYTRASTCTSSDASVTLAASGGVPPYQYSMDMINYQPGNSFSNLSAGLYHFFVRDANGCIAQYNSFVLGYLVNNFCSSATAISYTQFACTNDGMISFRNLGPDPSYTYSLDGIHYQADGNFTGLTSGFHTVYSKGSLGDELLVVIPIFQSCTIKIDFISIDAACGQDDGGLTVNASLGVAPYTYTIDGMNFQTSNTFTGLAPGIYAVAVRDANGVMNYGSGTVYDKCPALSPLATGESCTRNDGTITANATNGTAPYTYSLDGVNYQLADVFTGLAAGSYTVYLKDALGFTSSETVTVNNSCVSVFAVATDENCNKTNGSITAVATTGQPPYQFSIDGINFQSGGIFNGLPAGTYTVTVKDNSGQTGSTVAIIDHVLGAQIVLGANPSSCTDNDGNITVAGNGGKLPYQYSLDGIQYQATNVFAGLSSGNYTVYIRDAAGCETQDQLTIISSCPSVAGSMTSETCTNSNGTITVTGAGGTPPYEYAIDGVTFQSNTLFTGLAAGMYTITIKDAAGMINTAAVTVDNLCPVVAASVTDGKCTTNGGSIQLTGSNGTAPYEYSINGIDFQPGNTFSSLISGSYTITIRDANGLTNTTNVTVNNFPSPLLAAGSVAATCINNNGRITLTPSGGTAPLSYDLNGNISQSTAVFQNLAQGNYIATVTDANGCTASTPVVVAMINDLTLTMGNDITICEGEKAMLPATSNAAQFSWSPADGISNPSLLNPEVSPLVTSTYTLTAMLGVCTLPGSVTVTVKAAPIADAGENIVVCYGSDAILSGSGGVAYQWSPSTYLDNPRSQQPVVRKPQGDITYSLQVMAANGCPSLNTETVTVQVSPPPKLFAGNDTAIMLGQPFQLLAQDVNNSGFVDYNWSPSYGLSGTAIANPVAILDQNIRYTVTARTAAGCEGKDEINIKVYRGPEIYMANAFSPDNNRKNDIFKPVLIGIKKLHYFAVYNRWGQRVFYTTDMGRGWDGSHSGRKQPEEIFVWIVEGVGMNDLVIKKKGTVMLIR